MITRMLLASVLAIGASSFAGCGDTDCPASFAEGGSCSSEGLSCTAAASSCTCSGGVWACTDDLPFPAMHDLPAHPHDLSMPDQSPPGD
jgi:hypothetical protein